MIFCENLIKIYQIGDLEVLALQGLEFSVNAGEMVGIVGVSGSGKTTLLNVLGGLVRPSAGQVIVNGHNLLKLSDRALNRYRRTEVGFVWQQGARNLIPYLSALENVRFPMTLSGSFGKEAQERAKSLLEMVGLAERMGHYLRALSGGEQQRVAIAVALANNPSILLADEPTGELDSVTAQTIYNALRELNRQLRLTILIVSHDPQLTRQVDRVVAIRDGKTATETVRSQQIIGSENEESEVEQFEELTMLDSAGRLQLPKSYRDALHIGDRVQMELRDDGVMIHPVKRGQRQPEKPAVSPPPLVKDEKQSQRRHWLNWWRR
ncbi:MAG: ATP-binding cassette domain-containing protein [Chloroflexi bacterium]|nr:ATP-binding cassette domain-containing protein [Chloroflexota bacterium]